MEGVGCHCDRSYLVVPGANRKCPMSQNPNGRNQQSVRKASLVSKQASDRLWVSEANGQDVKLGGSNE
jgi:hypothetical protein